MLPIEYREARQSDIPFILNSWLKHYRYSPANRFMTDTVYFDGHSAFLRRLAPHVQCIVACNPEDQDQIFGYIVYQLPQLHFVYVKSAYQKLGIGFSLMEKSGWVADENKQFSHYTHQFQKFINRFKPKFNPYPKEET